MARRYPGTSEMVAEVRVPIVEKTESHFGRFTSSEIGSHVTQVSL